MSAAPVDRPRRVVVHAGFHKTGTSTLQRALDAGRAALPGWRVGLEADFPDAAVAARAYSVTGDPLEMGLFRAALADWVESLSPAPDENLVLSCESLAGEIPGRIGGARDYLRGRDLLPALAGVLRLTLGRGTQIRFLLTTRAPDAWLESLHWQLSRSVGMEEDLSPFAARMRPAADLAAQAQALSAAVAPDEMRVAALEDSAKRAEGPLAALFDAMELSPEARAPFAAPARANARPRIGDRVALAESFVAINRRHLTIEETRAEKKATLARLWAQQRRAARTGDNA